jgi:hypothetical protein
MVTLRRMIIGSSIRSLRRADSAFYGHGTTGATIKSGAEATVTVWMQLTVKTAITSIPDDV